MTDPDPLKSPGNSPGESPQSRLPHESTSPRGPFDPTPDFGLSPYQSPAILPDEEQAMVWQGDPVPAMPIAGSVLFALIASFVTIASATASSRVMNVYFPFALFFGPLVLIGFFVLTAIAFYSSNPLVISRSTGWKLLMTLLVPPVSMLVFVPTCVGSTMFMMPFAFRWVSSEWVMLIPVFIAYFVCAVVISRRLRWRFVKRVDPNESAA